MQIGLLGRILRLAQYLLCMVLPRFHMRDALRKHCVRLMTTIYSCSHRGAEGTVIEEPSVVPGLIWGLRRDASDVPLDRHRVGSGKAIIQPSSGHIVNESAHTASYTAAHIARETVMDDFLEQQKRIQPFDDKPRGQSSNILNFSNVREQSVANRHYRPSKQPLGEWSNRHERISSSEYGLGSHHSDMHTETHSPSASEKLERVYSLPDKEAVSTLRNYHDPYRQTSVGDFNHKQLIPNTVYSSILREQDYFNEGLDPSPSAPMIPPGHQCQSTRQTEITNKAQGEITRIAGENIPRIDDVFSRAHTDTYNTRRKHRITQNVLPTPPDSTSPLWSSGPSPQLGSPALAHSQIKTAQAQKPASQSFGLNIHAPTASLEELSDQLRQLILQQVNYDSMISMSHDTGPSHVIPPTQEKVNPAVPQRSRTKTTSMPPFKPSMPISLQDLVSRQTTNHTPAMESPALVTPTLPVTTQAFDETVVHNRIISAPAHDSFPNQHPPKGDYEYRAGRGDVLTGRRHPRSIPLSRLLEKKLASVPEETSFTNTTFEASPPTIRPAQNSASTVTRPAKKDYDFLELPSPVAEASAHELLSSQIESAGLEADRKAAAAGQYAKQKKRQQTKAKAPAGTPKSGKTATPKSERRSAPNDENVHLTGPSASASKKKPRTTQKTARVNEPAKRKADQQKARR